MPSHSLPFSILMALGLAGCSSPPALSLDAHHPASTTAPEAISPARRDPLRPDELTRKTHELLAKRAADAAAAEEPKGDAK